MITIVITKDESLIKSIVTDPVLWKLHGRTGEIDSYTIPEKDLWLLIKNDNDVIGLMQFTLFTYITAIAHIYILPVYHGMGMSELAIEAVKEFLKEIPDLRNIVCDVPRECNHVTKLLYKVGFQFTGLIEDGVRYNNKIQDILLFQLKLNRSL